ncbi:sodium/potassium-transporting ATPase subunit beta-2-like [Aricia agestis]|uniref:sodium/potassium-transporting ATPase subunit beta-2-like n=1 Tax=Aricia agestis TaxID=91739 RepID=UPI001C209E4E|nr:sodium/potassium-transporting ATPase subunit beta-2-like [Aricia agestis]
MGLDKRTIKIIAIVVAVLIVLGGITGLLLALFLPYRYVVLEVWPQSSEYNYEQPLIHFRASDPGSWHVWYKRISDFLLAYETTVPDDPPRAPCSIHRHDQRMPAPNCERALNMWAPCNADNFYGFGLGKPCVFLRLNNIHYWVPEPYNVSVPMAIPQDMPNYLKMAMQQYPAHRYGDYVWVSCNGEFSSDEENIGPIQYIPGALPPGFPTNRLHTADRIPRNTRHLPDLTPAPLLAVFFENPRRGVVINVECRIWTRDIVYDKSSRVGRARFELYVE